LSDDDGCGITGRICGQGIVGAIDLSFGDGCDGAPGRCAAHRGRRRCCKQTGRLFGRDAGCAKRICKSIDDSKRLNDTEGPGIIIAGSGMATGGRILHHLKRLLAELGN